MDYLVNHVGNIQRQTGLGVSVGKETLLVRRGDRLIGQIGFYHDHTGRGVWLIIGSVTTQVYYWADMVKAVKALI